jgi:ribonuclease HI
MPGGPLSLSCVEIHPEDTVVIYTDGSQKPKPRRGGIGIVLCWANDDGHEEERWESPPGYRGVTIPQMELKAVIEGLKLLLKKPPIVPPHLYRKVRVFCDANYVVENYDRARFQWSQNKWRNRDGAPIENGDLWRELLKIEKKLAMRVEILKVEATALIVTTRKLISLPRPLQKWLNSRRWCRGACVANRVRNVYAREQFPSKGRRSRSTSTRVRRCGPSESTSLSSR